MLLNMVIFKVTICDFGKMNINMTEVSQVNKYQLACL